MPGRFPCVTPEKGPASSEAWHCRARSFHWARVKSDTATCTWPLCCQVTQESVAWSWAESGPSGGLRPGGQRSVGAAHAEAHRAALGCGDCQADALAAQGAHVATWEPRVHRVLLTRRPGVFGSGPSTAARPREQASWSCVSSCYTEVSRHIFPGRAPILQVPLNRPCRQGLRPPA